MSNTTAPPGPPGTYQPQPPPRKKRHRLRTVLLSILGAFVVLIVIAVIAAPKTKPPAVGGGPTATATAAQPATPAAAPLSSGDQAFVTAVRARLAAKGFSNPATDATIASLADQVCKIRADGSSQADVIGANGAGKTQADFSMSPGKFVKLAEKDVCPKYLPAQPRILISFSGSGIRNSAPFLVSSGTLTVKYTYDCSATGSTGNFIADLVNGNQSSLSSDDQSIANALGNGGSQTTTLYPTNVGSDYHLEVNSECSWSVVVTG